MKLVLVGNYGAGNVGDEAILAYFLQRYPDVEWFAVTARPPKHGPWLPRLPLGVRSLFTPWWRTFQALRHSDGLVFGGGTLFADGEALKSCFLWGLHASVAMLFRKPIFLAFQGIGPFRTAIGKGIARFVLTRTVFLSVRDEASAVRVKELSPETICVRSFDPVFLMLEPGTRTRDPHAPKILVVIPRMNSSEEFLEHIRNAVKDEQYASVHILSLQPNDPHEKRWLQALSSEFQGPIIPIHSMEELTEQIRCASLVITQRYHGAFSAIALGVPFQAVPLKSGDKLDELQRIADPSILRKMAQQGEDALKQAMEKQLAH